MTDTPDPAIMSDAEHAALCKKSAQAIIDSGDVLNLFAQSWRKLVAGEEHNAKLLYLIATTRLFDRCMNAAIKGPSAAGKSNIRKTVLEFFPPEDVISFATISQKALLYFKEDFCHKILSMGEATGVEEHSLQDTLLRELISEGRLNYPVAQKIEGEGIVTTNIVKNGPVVFMVTTTKNALHPENETRLMSLEIDDTERQTRAVLRKVAQIEGLNLEITAINYEPWRDFQRWLGLGERRVVVPFAEKLSDLIPAASVRLRRDFGQVIRAIKAHALLHREQRVRDERGQIVADLELDYVTVANLLGGIVAAASGTSIEKGVQETIDAVRQATVGMSRDEGATADQIAKILRLETTTAWRRLNKAAFKGFVVNLETRPRQPGRYRITNKEVEVEDLLPSLEAIKGEAVQTVQTRNPIRKRQVFEEVNDCTTDCTIAPIASPSEDEVADVIDVAFEGPLLLEVTPKGHAALANDLAEADAAFQRRKAG